MVRKWKTARVFISSTFRDTHFERDAMTRLIFPELRSFCEQRFLHITEVDLRWGVTSEDSAAGKALQCCLQEIERSDFFLCIIGSRYGWVPDEYEVGSEEKYKWIKELSGLSITELEILHGALNPDETRAKNVSHALFYFRDESFLKALESQPKKLCEFTDGHTETKAGQIFYVPDEDKKSKLLSLKDRIVSASMRADNDVKMTVRENYSSLYTTDESLSGMNEKVLKEFCDMVLEDLKRAIDERYPLDVMQKTSKVDEMTEEQSYHSSYMEYRLNNFVDRPDLVERVRDYAMADVVPGPLLVTSESGMGKSTVLSKFVSDLEADLATKDNGKAGGGGGGSGGGGGKLVRDLSHSKSSSAMSRKPVVLIRYFAGAAPGSMQIHNMLRMLLQELRRSLKRHRPKKRADQLWGLVRASLRLGIATTLGSKAADNGQKPKQVAKIRHHKITSDIPSNYQDLAEDFKRTLVEVCEFAKVILVIDNLDHIHRDKNQAMTLRWLPHELPRTLRLIIGVDENRKTVSEPAEKLRIGKFKSFRRPTSPNSDSGVPYTSRFTVSTRPNRPTSSGVRSADGANPLKHAALSFANVNHLDKFEPRSFLESFQLHFKNHLRVEVPPLTPELAKEVVIARLELYGKRLSNTQMKILLGKQSAVNPTWLIIAVEELRIFTQFEKVTDRILELADDLPSLLEQMIKRLENDHGRAFVRDTLSILVCSRDGLYENEIVGILGVPLSLWSHLYYSIKPILAQNTRAGDGLISFSHRNFTLAILKHYFSDGSKTFQKLAEEQETVQLQQQSRYAVPIHARLAQYFKSLAHDKSTERWNAENGRALTCLPYHLLYGKMYRTLEKTLTDLQFIEALLTAGSGFSWIDDLSSALATFERYLAVVQNQLGNPGLGLDLSSGLALGVQAEDVLAARHGNNHSPPSPHLSPPHSPASVTHAHLTGQPQSVTPPENTVTEEMIRRIRDYASFAQAYTPELNANPHLVFQYASNLPDSSSAAVSAKRLWLRSQEKVNCKAWLRWINKPQETGPCTMTLCGHTAAVLFCDVSRDEKRVVTGSADCTVRVWIAQTGESPLVLEGHKDAVTCCVFSPTNNEFIVSSSRDGTVRVWVKGVCARVFSKHGSVPVMSCAVSECGRFVASGDQSGRLMIWHYSEDEDPIHDFSNFHGAISCCMFSPNNEYIFASSVDKTIRGWSLLDGSQYMCKSGETIGMSTTFVDEREKLYFCIRTSSMKLKLYDAKNVNRALSQPSCIEPSMETNPATVQAEQEQEERKAETMKRINSFRSQIQSERRPSRASAFEQDSLNDDDLDVFEDTSCSSSKDSCTTLDEGRRKIQKRKRGSSLKAKGSTRSVSFKEESSSSRDEREAQEEARGGGDGQGEEGEEEYGEDGEEFEYEDPDLYGASETSDSESDPEKPRRNKNEIARCVLSDPCAHMASSCGISSRNRVAIGRNDGNITVFNSISGERVCVLQGHIGRINHLAYSFSGQRLVSASDDHTVKIWNPKRAKLSSNTPHKTMVQNCTFNQSPKCLSLLSISQEGQVSLWNASNGYRTSLNSHNDPLRDAKFTPQGSMYVTISSSVRIFSASGDGKSWVIPQSNVGLWDISPCGKIFVCVEVGAFDMHVWSIHTNPAKRIRVISRAHSKKVTCIRFSRDGALLYTAGNDGKIKVWDSLKVSTELFIPPPFSPAAIALSKTRSKSKLLGNGMETEDAEDEVEEGVVTPLMVLHDPKDLGLASLIHAVFESPNGKLLLSVADSPDLKLWDLDHALEDILRGTAQCATTLHGHSTRVTCAAWAPHGYGFSSGSVNGSIRIWETQNLQCSTIINAHTSSVVDIRYMPDGRRLASISSDKSLSIWSASTGDQINSMIFGSPLNTFAISPTGRFLAVGDTKGDLRILEVMNPFLGMEVDVDQITQNESSSKENVGFESQEFPFVCPTKVVHITVKGSKKWDIRCQIKCPYCMRSFPINGNMIKQVEREEHNCTMQGMTQQSLRNLRLLSRCNLCRNVIRMTPFRLDRSQILEKVIWKERYTRRKLQPIQSKDMRMIAEHLKSSDSEPLTFYDPSKNEKMTPFHCKSRQKLPKLTTSSKKTEGAGSDHDLMSKHLHALSLKAKSSKRYKTFRNDAQKGDRRLKSEEEEKEAQQANFVKSYRKRNLKNRAASSKHLRLNSSVFQSSRVTTPNWLNAFSEIETNEEERQQQERSESISKVVMMNSTVTSFDSKFLEREGSLIRKVNTASMGARRQGPKVVKSTADLLIPENMYSIVHGRPRTSQLDAIRSSNPPALQISPGFIHFGILCQHCVYRYPVELLNTSASLMRFRCAVEVLEPEENDGEESAFNILQEEGTTGLSPWCQVPSMRNGSTYFCSTPKAKTNGTSLPPTPKRLYGGSSSFHVLGPKETIPRGEEASKNSVSVVQAPESNPLIHGLQAIVYIEIRAHCPGELNGVLRISTDSGHLFSTPIRAVVATKADFASSQRKALAINNEDITHPHVVQLPGTM